MANAYYKVLGWCSDRRRIYYQERKTGQIGSITASASAGPLLQLAPRSYWEEKHRSEKAPGFDVVKALDDVIQDANNAGVFYLDRVRGRGVWMDGTQVVWHLGDRLEVGGKQMGLLDFQSSYHYQRLPRLDVDPATAPLSDAQGALILQAVKAMGWITPLDHLHLLGWVVLATVSGALDKRPVLQITCGFGQGKTYTLTVVILPLLGGPGLAICESNSSEAAIRQTLNTNTLPVLIDESEGEDQHRREGHLKLARLSFDGRATSRGTTHGKALTYAVRSSMALVGINAVIANPADRSRTVVVGRKQLDQQEWATVDRKLRELVTVKTGAMLLRRCVTHLPTLQANVATFRRVVEAKLPSGAAARAGDTYGALLAGAHLLLNTAQVDEQQAIAWLARVGWDAEKALGLDAASEQSAAAEGAQCLAKLLSHEEQWRSDAGTGRVTIRELLELARSPSGADGADEAERARKALGRRGIKATDHALVIANNPELLAPIYGNGKWRNGGHVERLRDLPGAEAAGPVHFKVMGPHRATTVPWAAAGF
jgi:hypothetical protein